MESEAQTGRQEQETGQLALADGTCWDIRGYDRKSAEIVSHFVKTLGLQRNLKKPTRHLIIYLKTAAKQKIKKSPSVQKSHTPPETTYFCEIDPPTNKDTLAIQLMKIASIIRQDTEKNMGFLVHGALAAFKGKGVILAGYGGIGKTTSIERLPDTWDASCDDTTLIIQETDHIYSGHPWPTWSRLMFDGPGGAWDINEKFPVAGVYFLERADVDRTKPIEPAEAACRMVKSTEEALIPIALRTDEYDSREMRLKRLDNICRFCEIIPSFILYFTKDGKFWKEIEKDIIAV